MPLFAFTLTAWQSVEITGTAADDGGQLKNSFESTNTERQEFMSLSGADITQSICTFIVQWVVWQKAIVKVARVHLYATAANCYFGGVLFYVTQTLKN